MMEIGFFQQYLERLPEDLEFFVKIASIDDLPSEERAKAAGAVNYFFKSVDLIPDGIDEIGYLDDVITLRVMADWIDIDEIGKHSGELASRLKQLREDAQRIKEALGQELYTRLSGYVAALRSSSARGRSAFDIVTDSAKLQQLKMEVGNFCRDYVPPRIDTSEKTLIKLKSFLDTKLPHRR